MENQLDIIVNETNKISDNLMSKRPTKVTLYILQRQYTGYGIYLTCSKFCLHNPMAFGPTSPLKNYF